MRVGPVRDSLVGMALVLQLMADTGKSLSQLAAEVGGYTIYKSKYPADKQQASEIIEQAKAAFDGATLNTSDGCRYDLSDGWIHIRTSNTEPIMRVILETKTDEAAQKYTQTVEQICRTVLNK